MGAVLVSLVSGYPADLVFSKAYLSAGIDFIGFKLSLTAKSWRAFVIVLCFGILRFKFSLESHE